jgi:GAF domain-containing protein
MPRRQRWQLPNPEAAAQAADPSLTVVAEIAHALARADDVGEAYQFALDRACPAVGATLGAVFVLDGVSELMHVAAAHAWPERWRPWLGEMRVRLGFGPSGEAASERRLIEVPDVFADSSLEDWQEVARELGFRALVAVPLEASGGVVVGAASFYFDAPGTRAPAAKALIRTTADLMAAMAELDTLRRRIRMVEAALEDERPAPLPRTGDAGDNEATDS